MGDWTSVDCDISTDLADYSTLPTLRKRKDQQESPHAVPRWFAQYTMNIDEE